MSHFPFLLIKFVWRDWETHCLSGFLLKLNFWSRNNLIREYEHRMFWCVVNICPAEKPVQQAHISTNYTCKQYLQSLTIWLIVTGCRVLVLFSCTKVPGEPVLYNRTFLFKPQIKTIACVLWFLRVNSVTTGLAYTWYLRKEKCNPYKKVSLPRVNCPLAQGSNSTWGNWVLPSVAFYGSGWDSHASESVCTCTVYTHYA